MISATGKKTRFVLAAIALVVTAAISVGLFVRFAPHERAAASRPLPVVAGEHQPHFFVRDFFYNGISTKLPPPIDAASADDRGRAIKGALVPHHYVGSAYIGEAFTMLAEQAPTTVLLIGPNHYEAGDAAFLTSAYAWPTPFGTVYPDVEAQAALTEGELVRFDEDVADNEHSVSGIMPFIAKYLPGARVVPVMLKHNPDPAPARELARRLAALAAQPGTVIVASVDFSHYLTSEAADRHDAETLAAMRGGNDAMLLGYANDNIDSPISVVTLMRAMRALGGGGFRLLRHENSGRILRDDAGSTTSYFTAIFYADPHVPPRLPD